MLLNLQLNGFKQGISFEQPEAHLHRVLLPLTDWSGLDETQYVFPSSIKVVGQADEQVGTTHVKDEVEVEYKVLISTTLFVIINLYIKYFMLVTAVIWGFPR